MEARRGSVWKDAPPRSRTVGVSEMFICDSVTPTVPGFIFVLLPDISMSGYHSVAPMVLNLKQMPKGVFEKIGDPVE